MSLGKFLMEAQAVTHKRCAVDLTILLVKCDFIWKAASVFSEPSAA